MKVSVVIATYGEESWRELALERAFPSAKDQGAHEIIVGHDPFLSIAQVRNALARKASGDWLCFLDADDELQVGYLDAMREALEFHYEASRSLTRSGGARSGGMRHGKVRRAWECEVAVGADILLTPAVQKMRHGRKAGAPDFYPEIDLLTANWLIVGTVLSRDLFMRAGGFSDYPHGFEDWSLWFKCTKLQARVVRVSEAIYVQHVNNNSKHRVAWRNRRLQAETHRRIQRELEAWTP